METWKGIAVRFIGGIEGGKVYRGFKETVGVCGRQGEHCSRIPLCNQDALCVKRSVQGGYTGHRKPG